jgi:hypothetical protein
MPKNRDFQRPNARSRPKTHGIFHMTCLVNERGLHLRFGCTPLAFAEAQPRTRINAMSKASLALLLVAATSFAACPARADDFADWQAKAKGFGNEAAAAIAASWDLQAWSDLAPPGVLKTLKTTDRFAGLRELGPLIETRPCNIEQTSVLTIRFNITAVTATVSCWVSLEQGRVALLISMATIGDDNWQVTEVYPLIE